MPSLTEAIAATTPGLLVGATDWCTHPPDLVVTRVRGTKNPDLAAIAALEPDLVVCNQEENRRLDVERLRERGIPVWVTVIESVDQALASMRRLLVEALALEEPEWWREASRVWAEPVTPQPVPRRVAIPVWRDPWMVVGAGTYTGDVLERLGFVNAFGARLAAGAVGAEDRAARYPHVDVAAIRAAADLVVLPDEPYAFGPLDGPEVFREGDGPIPTVCVDGRSVTWYGPAMVAARSYLEQVLAPWRG
ncbi:helical backbone metal receptor [Raineyella fluvialis]|uniref:helical backbone metal receptor n=1 Tax=Raineyella fluvialis TaxID=2662261 RepID=UPI0030CDBABC